MNGTHVSREKGEQILTGTQILWHLYVTSGLSSAVTAEVRSRTATESQSETNTELWLSVVGLAFLLGRIQHVFLVNDGAAAGEEAKLRPS